MSHVVCFCRSLCLSLTVESRKEQQNVKRALPISPRSEKLPCNLGRPKSDIILVPTSDHRRQKSIVRAVQQPESLETAQACNGKYYD